MSSIQQLQQAIVAFRDSRDWKQFHNPKNLAIGLNVEASELLEHFQWLTETESTKFAAAKQNEVALELADILYYVLLMAHDLNIDLDSTFEEKMKLNAIKYPVEKAKGTATKYTEL